MNAEALAEVAYNAYKTSLENFQGHKMFEWSEITESSRKAWVAATVAILEVEP